MPQRKKIFVVDDDPNVGLLVSAVLKKYDYSVTPMSSGEQVLETLRTMRPDLILLDLRMPGMDGYTLCRRIRDNRATADIPIIILSGVSEVDARINTLELGADDFITKPFDMRELRARVNRIIKRKVSDTALSPLTGLPGGPLIEEEAQKRLEAGEDFSFAYIDIDNFKAYNDVYGYARGDEVIKKLAAVTQNKIRELSDPQRCFLGHIGGDDFVLFSPREEGEPLAGAIAAEFDRQIPYFYTPEHRLQGYISTTDRKNRHRRFPIMSISIALITPGSTRHYAKLVEKAAEIKRYLKDLPGRKGSAFHKDRRE
ncbi:MAG TPA: response regulator [Elusimicrobiales bacterium]|nr:response regulator [Elusimicrobiales bacterium]